jgi:hypothetical protein
MTKSKFPRSIVRMIEAARSRGWNSKEIATHINSSKLAKNLKVHYSTRTIAAKLANYNR